MSWLDRQSFLGPDSEEVLAKTTIGIVGLGGGGSHVAQQLAHVGIGTFVLIDPDTIEETNLNRLVGGTWADVEAEVDKVAIAKRLIKGVRPGANVQAVKGDWQTVSQHLKICDVIVGSLDSVRAKDELDAFCRRFLIPYIDQGMDVHGTAGHHLIAGQVVLSCPGRPCLRCFGVVTDEALAQEGRNYGAAGGKPQVIWPNGVLASTAVGLVMQLVAPWFQIPTDSAYLEYDGNRGTVVRSHRMKLLAGRVCPHYPADERGDPLFDVRRLVIATEPESAVHQSVKARSLKARLWMWCQRLLASGWSSVQATVALQDKEHQRGRHSPRRSRMGRTADLPEVA